MNQDYLILGNDDSVNNSEKLFTYFKEFLLAIGIFIVSGLIIGVFWYVFIRPYNIRLPKPVGEMILKKSPYKELNNPEEETGHIDASRIKSQDWFGRYGYRAIKKNSDGKFDFNTASEVMWNEKFYVVFDHTKNANDIGFTWEIPKQKDELNADNIYFQLIGDFYHSQTGFCNHVIFGQVELGEIKSTDPSLIIKESDKNFENILLEF